MEHHSPWVWTVLHSHHDLQQTSWIQGKIKVFTLGSDDLFTCHILPFAKPVPVMQTVISKRRMGLGGRYNNQENTCCFLSQSSTFVYSHYLCSSAGVWETCLWFTNRMLEGSDNASCCCCFYCNRVGSGGWICWWVKGWMNEWVSERLVGK